MAFTVRETAQGAQFALRVQPRAGRTAFAGIMGDAIKLAITAPPVDGKANQAVIEFLAKRLHTAKSSVVILSGETGRNKLIEIRGVSAEKVRKVLGV